jgi:hypothetical protein
MEIFGVAWQPTPGNAGFGRRGNSEKMPDIFLSDQQLVLPNSGAKAYLGPLLPLTWHILRDLMTMTEPMVSRHM